MRAWDGCWLDIGGEVHAWALLFWSWMPCLVRGFVEVMFESVGVVAVDR